MMEIIAPMSTVRRPTRQHLRIVKGRPPISCVQTSLPGPENFSRCIRLVSALAIYKQVSGKSVRGGWHRHCDALFEDVPDGDHRKGVSTREARNCRQQTNHR
jgi:hypothetical protein